MSNPTIQFENIWKEYKLGQYSVRTLHEDIERRIAKFRKLPDPNSKLIHSIPAERKNESSESFWALKNVNLEISEGDIVGIIGPNGAGKSTLLKILSRITTPTEGTVRIRGRTASMLEVGTGFHPNLTGRENVYLNGSIMGMSKREISTQFDDIVGFSGCAQHIDTPIKRYSSGMIVRLGFAVAAHLRCENMVVDEVLAVGDQAFTNRAIEKMNEISNSDGRTILFVSHNLGIVKSLCKSGIVMTNGTAQQYDTINEAIENYSKTDSQNGYFKSFATIPNKPSITTVSIDSNQARLGNLIIEIGFESPYQIEPNPGIILYSENFTPVLGSNSKMHSPLEPLEKCHRGILRCEFNKLPLHEGKYHISVILGDSDSNQDWKEYALTFDFYPQKIAHNKPDFEYRGATNWTGDWQFRAVDSKVSTL